MASRGLVSFNPRDCIVLRKSIYYHSITNATGLQVDEVSECVRFDKNTMTW